MKRFLLILWFFGTNLLIGPYLYGQTIDIYSRPVQYEPSRNYDAIHYRVSLTFDLDRKYFQGENVVTLTPFKDNLNMCALHAQGLVVDDVVNALSASMKFEQKDGHLIIHFGCVVQLGDTVRFVVRYHGSDPEKGLYFEDENSVHPRVVTTDSWPDEARYWYPCYDYPHDKATQEMIITVKNPLKVLSNGRLVDIVENKAQGTRTYYYHQERPHSTYLSMLAIGPYAVIQDSLESLPIHYWVYPKDVGEARWIFKNTPAIIAFFNQLFDYPYPWAKYDQVVSPNQGGGAEATSATILGEGVIHDRRAEQDFSWERIIAHEAAHQWWGDLITLRSWEHTWMNEGFGTYSDYLYTLHQKGEDEGSLDLLGKKNQYLREAQRRYIRPIVFNRYNHPQDNFDSHTYPKAAAVLHMLRFILGDKPFFRTFTYFLNEYEFQAVDTHDFMTAVKEATGQNLDWFFEQCIFKPGHPYFDIQYQWKEAGRKVIMEISQIQDTTRGIPIYRLPVNIGITTSQGTWIEKIWISRKKETFVFPADSKPLLVRFDDGNHLLKEWTFRKSPEELIFQLQRDDVIGRMWAAAELVKYKIHPGVVEALATASGKELFWSVREAAIEALAEISGEIHFNLYKQLCQDPHSRVRTTALRILGDFKDSSLMPYFRDRFESDDSYLAQAEALRSLGKCGDLSQLDFLKKSADMSSPRDIIKRAAEWAISQIQL